MPAAAIRKLRIFAASASDVLRERAKVEAVTEMLKPLADHLGIVLDVADWRSAVPDMGRPEQVILDQLKPTEWDVFIGILWHRFGTPSGSKDAQTFKEYLSGTEEEFQAAYRLWRQFGQPRIMIYRCIRAIPPDVLEPDQFARVMEFLKQFGATKGDHPGLYQHFESTEDFQNLLLENLQRLLLRYSEQISGKPVAPHVVEALVPKIPNNLPRRAPFFGRDSEMAIVLQALSPEDRTWGVLVDGIGGNGKTALALEAAYRCKEGYAFDAFIFVSAKQNVLRSTGIRQLTPAARTVDDFLNDTAHVLSLPGIAQLPSPAKHRELIDALRSTRALLIYDNLETLTKEEQEAIAEFLRGLPQGCKAIITSRRRGGEGGVWLRLDKLEWEASRAIIQNELERSDELRDKLEAVGEKRWPELYDETRGSPLALVHTLGLMRVRTALTFDSAVAMLRGNRLPDLQSFIFSEAQRELTINDQTALYALSFFASSATFEAWAEVANLSRNALETAGDRLGALALVDVLAGVERFALHPLTRNFVREELLSNTGVEHAIGTQFVDYWLAYAKRYGEIGKQGYLSYEKLESEWKNLEAAADWLCETGVRRNGRCDLDAAKKYNEFVQAMTAFFFFSGRWDELLRYSASAYELMVTSDDWSAAGSRAHRAAWISNERGDAEEASRWVECCDRAWSRIGSRESLATVTHMRGLVASTRKEYDLAGRLLGDALAIYRELESDVNVSLVLTSLGNLELARKAYGAAEHYFSESLDMDQRRDDKYGTAVSLCNLGDVAIDQERWVEARELGERALQLARHVGAPYVIAAAAFILARAHVGESRHDRALPFAQEAAVIYERLRHSRLIEVKELLERLPG